MPDQQPHGAPIRPNLLSRRSTLRLAASVLAAGPVAAACAPADDSDKPDPLIALENAARMDAATATATAATLPGHADVLQLIAAERTAHAQALRAEVARAKGVYRDGTTPTRDPDPLGPVVATAVESLRAIRNRIAGSRRVTTDVAAGLTGYRAGLLGSIAAACAVETDLVPASTTVAVVPSSPPPTGAPGSGEADSLTTSLHAEYAAVFAYGLVGAYSRPERADQIAKAVAAHRAHRDALVGMLTAAHATVPPAAAGYATSVPVSDPASAARLAVTIEHDTAVAWRAALEQSGSPAARRFAIDAITDCALRLAQWRAIVGISPATTAFPGSR